MLTYAYSCGRGLQFNGAMSIMEHKDTRFGDTFPNNVYGLRLTLAYWSASLMLAFYLRLSAVADTVYVCK